MKIESKILNKNWQLYSRSRNQNINQWINSCIRNTICNLSKIAYNTILKLYWLRFQMKDYKSYK